MRSDLIAPVHDPILKSSPIFSELSELELNAVAAFLEHRKIKRGEEIFNEGETGEEMFILLSGKISAWISQADGSRRWMFEIKPGDFFGEMSIIANETRSATLTARTDTEVVVFSGIDFYRIIYELPMIGVKMLTAIRRVQNTWLEQTSRYLSNLLRWGEVASLRAVSDEVTGLYNRRFLEETAHNRFEKGSVGQRSLSLLMMDLDKIHEVNDKYGQAAGDLVFIWIAGILRSITRPEDICARLAGDEFAILLPDTGPAEAGIIAERIRSTIDSEKAEIPRGKGVMGRIGIKISTSIGIASAPSHANTWESLYLAADGALRKSKSLGRNRVEIAK